MKDEEMAEEWWNNWVVKDWNDLQEGKRLFIQAFLDGLKAGKTQWHDLEKDPNDLPKHTNSVLGYCRGDYYDVCFFNGKRLIGHGESDFLKWKEIE